MGWFNHQPICLKNHFPCKDLVHHPMETTFAGVFPKPIGSKMTRDQTPKFPLRNCINHESLLFGIWDGEPLPLGEDQMTKTDHRWPPNVYPQKQWDGVNGAWGWYLKSGQNLWFSSKIPRFRAMILATSLGYLLKRPFWCEFDFFLGWWLLFWNSTFLEIHHDFWGKNCGYCWCFSMSKMFSFSIFG